MGEGSIETEDGSGSGDTNDHLPILGPAGRQFQISAANEVEAAGVFALTEERCLWREADSTGDELEVGQNCAAKRAEPSRPAIGARSTANRRLSAEDLLPPRCGRGNSQSAMFLPCIQCADADVSWM